MLKYKNLTIVGTSHIAETSIKQIEGVFQKEQPAIIAVELDRQRMHALLTKQEPNYSPRLIREIGLKGYLFAVIGGMLQQKLGRIVGVKPGSDMLRALELARDNQRKIALIDRDVRMTLQRLSKAIGWKEKFNFILDILLSPFSKKNED